jgi:hypothetical protein
MPTVTEQPTPTPNPTSTPEPTPNPTATEVLNDIPLSFNYSLGMGSLSWSGLTLSELSEATCNALVGNYIISQYYGTLGVGTQFYNPNNISSNQSWVTNQYFGTNNAPNGIWVQGSTEHIIETDFNGVVTRYESFNVTCPSPTSTPTPEPTSTPQPTPMPTVTENPTSTPNPTATEQPTPMPTATEPPTATPQPTSTPEPTPNSNVQLNFYNDLNGLTVSRIYVNTNVYDTGDFPMSSNENTTLTGLSHTNGLVGLQIVYDFQSQNSPKNIYVYVDGELDVTTYTSTDITFTIGNTIPVQDNSIITVRQYSTPLPTSSPTPEPTSTPIPTSTPEPTEVLGGVGTAVSYTTGTLFDAYSSRDGVTTTDAFDTNNFVWQLYYAHQEVTLTSGTQNIGLQPHTNGSNSWTWFYVESNSQDTIGNWQSVQQLTTQIYGNYYSGVMKYSDISNNITIPEKTYFMIGCYGGPYYRAVKSLSDNRTAMVSGQPFVTAINKVCLGNWPSGGTSTSTLPSQLGGSDNGYTLYDGHSHVHSVTFN